MKIIGIAGTDGSGKDSLGKMIVDHRGWQFISVTDLLREEAQERGLKLDRSVLRKISAEWRREYGLGVLIDKALHAFNAQQPKAKNNGLVIASLRNPGEADRVHELGGKVVWVDADPKVRYARIKSRARGTEDQVTFEEFLAEEKAQSQHEGDEATLNLSKVKEKSDIFLTNNSNNIDAFKKEIEEKLFKAAKK